jgi:hypothetical protein
VADTWDEAACRARLAATTPGPWVLWDSRFHPLTFTDPGGSTGWPEGGMCWLICEDGAGDGEGFAVVFGSADRNQIQPQHSDLNFLAHAPADLGAALAEIDRLRAALEPFAELARRPEYQSWPGNASLVIYGTFGTPNLGDCRRAAAALGAARD